MSTPDYFPEGEITARLRALSSDTPVAGAADPLERYRQAAAVMVAFNPATLRPMGTSPSTESDAMSLMPELVRSPDEKEPGRFGWALPASARQNALRALDSRANLQKALSANPARPSSLLQRTLVQAIEGASFEPEELGASELAALTTVSMWLAHTEPGKKLPRTEQLRSEMERRRDQFLLERLAGKHFTGREGEIIWVWERLLHSKSGMVFIHGPGGTGKSALLAQVLLGRSEEFARPSPLWIRVDLDRSNVSPENPLTIIQEAVTQLQRRFPAFDSLLSGLLRAARGSTFQGPISESSDGLEDRLLSITAEFVSVLGILTLRDPLVLWLDTFEEAQYLGPRVCDELLSFLETIVRQSSVRVVLSGRTPLTGIGSRMVETLTLGDLTPPVAETLLRKLLKDFRPDTPWDHDPLIARAVQEVGGNPLTLHLAAELIATEGTAILDQPGSLKKEALQRWLYSRILQHLHDPDLEKLAVPGLVLRRITAEIIREVLAPVCGLGEITAAQASALLDAFSGELTLVEREADGSLRHRQDIRLLMLEGMPADMTADIRRIDEAAHRFWSARKSPEARAEELYHLLRLDAPSLVLDTRWTPAVAPLLRSALDEFAPDSAAYLWLARKLQAGITDEAAEKLSQPEWEELAETEAKRLLLGGNNATALLTLQARPERLPASRLYILESRTQLLLGQRREALEIAWRGFSSLRMINADKAAELAHLAAFILEGDGQTDEALGAINLARECAEKTANSHLLLSTLARQLRILRRLGLPLDEIDLQRAVQVAREDPKRLRSDPALLRETAAEIGARDPRLMELAADVLLEPSLAKIGNTSLVAILGEISDIPKIATPELVSAEPMELRQMTQSSLLERLHRSSNSDSPAIRILEQMFRREVDEIVFRDSPSGARARTIETAVPERYTDNFEMRDTLAGLIGEFPEDIQHRFARFRLSSDFAQLREQRSSHEAALELANRAFRMGRVGPLLEDLRNATSSPDLLRRLGDFDEKLQAPPALEIAPTIPGTPTLFSIQTHQTTSANPMLKAPLRNLLKDAEVMQEIQNTPEILQSANSSAGAAERLDVLLGGDESVLTTGNYTHLEAIILLEGRPALLIQDGVWQDPGKKVIRDRLALAESGLKATIPKVGRIEILDYNSDYIGTGWMIEEDVMITNRHVASCFGGKLGGSFTFRSNPSAGEAYRVRVDFRREYERSAIHQAAVKEILFIEDDDDLRPDMALVRLDRAGGSLPAPIELDDVAVANGNNIAVIGYPARDPRNDAFAMQDYFKGIFNVKRLSPGLIIGVRADGKLLEHDCTTLGGNSGSVVYNLETRKACGLHFSGTYLDRNLAVTSAWLKSRLSELGRPRISVPLAIPPAEGSPAPAPVMAIPAASTAEAVPDLSAGRTGYLVDFLGQNVDLPELGKDLEDLVAPVTGRDDGLLTYTHFSIRMRKDRRMPFYTAVNIDGGQLFNFVRGRDQWFPESRLIDQGHQILGDLYQNNPLDRGHLVRRLDPAWGSDRAEAKQAEIETFFFTNCTPQHAKLNQKTWLSLEEYILGHAANDQTKVSVFTGPVMQETDRDYREVKIPEEFWKVAVIVNGFTGKLSATGYIISQADYLSDLEFVFGEFKTYQIPLSQIEEKTGLFFGLTTYDPLSRIETRPQRLVASVSDLIL